MPVHLRRKKRPDGSLKGYYAEFYDASRKPPQKRLSLGTRDSQTARQKLADWERQYAMGLFDPWLDKPKEEGVTAAEAMERFLADRAEHCTTSTVDTYGYVLRPMVDTLGPAFPLYGVEARHIEARIATPKSEHTRKTHADRLRIFFDWCVAERLIERSPMPKRKRAKGQRDRKKAPLHFLSEDEYERLIACIETDAELKGLDGGNGWLLDAVRVAVGSGMRLGELVALEWGAVDLASGVLHVRNTEGFTTKSGRERPVPIVGEALPVIERLHAEAIEQGRRKRPAKRSRVLRGSTGGDLAGDYLSERFRFYRRMAALPEAIHFHSLRHTFASWWVQRGGDLYRLKEVMGHADLKTTMKYAQLRPESLIDEARRLFPEASVVS
ncbi:MAG: site-specific integrase [Bacteroidota bacterium]